MMEGGEIKIMERERLREIEKLRDQDLNKENDRAWPSLFCF